MLAILLVALSVGLDNFAASIGLGTAGVTNRLRLQIGVVFGLFEGGMPVIGLLIGHKTAHAIGGSAHYVGGGLLIAAGAYALLAERLGKKQSSAGSPGRSTTALVVIGLGLSIDNLVVGFALGSVHVALWTAAVVIAAVSVTLSLVGLEFGRRLGSRFGEWGEAIGGLVLIGVGSAIAAGAL
jgi:putative Mn2+ efflux pump MntP